MVGSAAVLESAALGASAAAGDVVGEVAVGRTGGPTRGLVAGFRLGDDGGREGSADAHPADGAPSRV